LLSKTTNDEFLFENPVNPDFLPVPITKIKYLELSLLGSFILIDLIPFRMFLLPGLSVGYKKDSRNPNIRQFNINLNSGLGASVNINEKFTLFIDGWYYYGIMDIHESEKIKLYTRGYQCQGGVKLIID